MKKISALLLLAFIYSGLTAQYRWDIGLNLGAANYLGEIGGNEETRRDFVLDMQLDQTQWVVGGFARYRVSPQLSFNTGLNYGRIRGFDGHSENPARVARNLNFRNDIIELSIRTELTLLYDNDVGGRGYYDPDFKLYGFLGVAIFYHNPQAKFEDGYVDLIDLKTEGVEYSNFQLSIPAGIGLYFTYRKLHRIGWELGYRFAFTDYLDDVSTTYAPYDELGPDRELASTLSNRTSQKIIDEVNAEARSRGLQEVNLGSFAVGEKRGDPTNNDGYLFTQFSYSFVIKGNSKFSKARYSWIKKKKRKRRKTRAKF